jgi:hypothetical protein
MSFMAAPGFEAAIMLFSIQTVSSTCLRKAGLTGPKCTARVIVVTSPHLRAFTFNMRYLLTTFSVGMPWRYLRERSSAAAWLQIESMRSYHRIRSTSPIRAHSFMPGRAPDRTVSTAMEAFLPIHT